MLNTREPGFLCVVFVTLGYSNFLNGEQCHNQTAIQCNVHQVAKTVNNCTKCVCREGYYQDHNIGGCKLCTNCTSPNVIKQNCTSKSDTKCVRCEDNYYRIKDKCQKCKTCKHGIHTPCGEAQNTICASVDLTKPTTSNTETTTNNLKFTIQNQVDSESKEDWKKNPIWCTLFFIESITVILLIISCLVCRSYSRKLYVLNDTASLATSLSSIFFSKSKAQADITSLTAEELNTLLRTLPGGYAELLGQLLNPNIANNWIHLAYEFKLNLIEIGNLKTKSPDFTQELIASLCTRNITVEILWKALRNIGREDACSTLVNFILDLRKDNAENAILLLNEV